MKKDRYTLFRNAVATANAQDPIWWAGYLWLDLTKKQSADIVKVLETRNFKHKIDLRRGTIEIVLPSGIGIIIND